MKLLNQSLSYLAVSIFVILTIWSLIFYYNITDEFYDSFEDSLKNYKMLIIEKAMNDPQILAKNRFDESNYAIKAISREKALSMTDTFKDTLLYMVYEEDEEAFRMLTTAFQNENKYYQLKVITSIIEEDDVIEDMMWSIFWLYIILMGSIVIINNVFLKKIWSPFYKLLDHIKYFRVDKGVRLSPIQSKTYEFLQLQKGVNTLTSHAVEAYSSQKEFTENAAHELQTPLAIIINKLELLIESGKLQEEEIVELAEVLDTTYRLKSINKSLLLLSKIANKQYGDLETVNFAHLTQQTVGELEDFIAFKNINVTITEEDNLNVSFDPALAHILVSNLVNNAISHNHQDGKIGIEIKKDQFVIWNTSLLKEQDPDAIFKRFYNQSSSNKSTGLGLAIIQEICNLYGVQITYHYDDYHYFTLQF